MEGVEKFIEDPRWADVVPDAEPPGKTRHLPAHEDCSPISVEAVQSHLRRGGTLGGMDSYEERPGQIDMTGAIADAFNSRQNLMIEAGTGVGKSLAYLVPSIIWAWTNDTPVVISTATRNLQSQLVGSDIPKALAVLGENAGAFRVALLKGRANYLCLKSADEYFSSGYWTLPAEEQEALPGFVAWLSSTPDGDLDCYDGPLRQYMSRPGDECGGRRCPFHRKCFVYKARRRAAESHMVIANHALVIAEAASSPGGGILPGYGRLVLDEAHNLESIATEYLGSEFSMPALNRVVKRLLRHHRDAARQAAEVLGAAERFISFLGGMLPEHADSRRFDASRFYWEDTATLKRLQTAFEQPLISLVHRLHDTAARTEDPDAAAKLDASADQLLAVANEAAFVVKGELDTHAYWVERVRDDKRRLHIRLAAAPLSVAGELNEIFYEAKDTVVLSSATLRVGNDFKYMARRLGTSLSDRFRYLTATSPFDYFRQSLVLAPDCLPDPSAEPAKYAAELSALMKELFSETGGRALALFTSYEMMNAVAAAAQGPLAEAGIRLLVQGGGLSREAMTKRLREETGTVVFGAQSFWEGVDIAGDALSCVVLARLPFSQVGDPMVEARSELIERSGGNAFRDYTLPEAVIKFRQGFGRLIRKKSDRGVVVVADPRVVTKSYGAVFRKSIPASVHTVTGTGELLRRAREFLQAD